MRFIGRYGRGDLNESYHDWKRSLHYDYCLGEKLHEIHLDRSRRHEPKICPHFETRTGRCLLGDRTVNTGQWLPGRCLWPILERIADYLLQSFDDHSGMNTERLKDDKVLTYLGTHILNRMNLGAQINILTWVRKLEWFVRHALFGNTFRMVCGNCESFRPLPQPRCLLGHKQVRVQQKACKDFGYATLETVELPEDVPEPKDPDKPKEPPPPPPLPPAKDVVRHILMFFDVWAKRPRGSYNDAKPEIRSRQRFLFRALVQSGYDKSEASKRTQEKFGVGPDTVKKDWAALRAMLRRLGYSDFEPY